MSYPRDHLHSENLEHIIAHVKEKGGSLVRLHIKTNKTLYQSVDPKRTNQIMALDPIPLEDILKVERIL